MPRKRRCDDARRPRTTEESLGLRIIDIESGQRTAARESEATGIRLTSDGAHLLLDRRDGGELITEVIDADSLESVATVTQWRIWLARDLEGAPIILAIQFAEELTRFAVLESRTFEVVDSWSVNGFAWWVTP